jgi:hypothetical protein
MLGFYLFAAVLGGGLLVLSLLGGDGDGGGHGVGGHDVGGHDVGHGHGGGHDAGHGHAGHQGPGDLLLGFFKPRNLVFFLAAFGLTGAALTWLNQASSLTLGFATGMGLGAMAINHALFTWLARTDAAIDTLGDADLEGVSARVVINVEPGRAGRVVCVVAGREQYITARLASGISDPIPAGREVVIVAVDGGVAQIAPLDLLGVPSASPLLE